MPRVILCVEAQVPDEIDNEYDLDHIVESIAADRNCVLSWGSKRISSNERVLMTGYKNLIGFVIEPR